MKDSGIAAARRLLLEPGPTPSVQRTRWAKTISLFNGHARASADVFGARVSCLVLSLRVAMRARGHDFVALSDWHVDFDLAVVRTARVWDQGPLLLNPRCGNRYVRVRLAEPVRLHVGEHFHVDVTWAARDDLPPEAELFGALEWVGFSP